MTVNVNIENLPAYAEEAERGYIVARQDSGELWFYGLYDGKKQAENVAVEIGNGVVLEVA